MSKITCNIIMDLLPLYIDGVISEDGRKAVEEHISECEECRKRYELMEKQITINYSDEAASLKRIKSDINNNKRIIAAISVLCTTLVISFLFVMTGVIHQSEMTDVIFKILGFSGLLLLFGVIIFTRIKDMR